MTYRIDFTEPMPDMIERLKMEHSRLIPELQKIEQSRDLKEAISFLEFLKSTVMKHAVEEEARVMRVIMAGAKREESSQAVKIMQEHRWVADFFEHTLGKLAEQPPERAWEEIRKFVRDLHEHFHEEEEVVFPLALKSL